MSKNTGGPAFPRAAGQITEHLIKNSKYNLSQDGMTLRQYYVGQALKGYLAGGIADPAQECATDPESVGKWAVKYADAALAEEAK